MNNAGDVERGFFGALEIDPPVVPGIRRLIQATWGWG
jgi:hypothetical protein